MKGADVKDWVWQDGDTFKMNGSEYEIMQNDRGLKLTNKTRTMYGGAYTADLWKG